MAIFRLQKVIFAFWLQIFCIMAAFFCILRKFDPLVLQPRKTALGSDCKAIYVKKIVTDGRTDEQMNGRTDERTDGRTDVSVEIVI